MTHYQHPMRLYQHPATNMPLVRRASVDRTAPRVRVAARSIAAAIRLLVAGIFMVAVLLLAVELTLGISYEGQPGPMPAPAPSPMR